jgi:alcohol dehydrogenase class IV
VSRSDGQATDSDAAEGDAAARLAAHFHALADRLGLATRLRDFGIPRADLPRLAAEALQQQRLLVNNPRVVGEADALAIYESAY